MIVRVVGADPGQGDEPAGMDMPAGWEQEPRLLPAMPREAVEVCLALAADPAHGPPAAGADVLGFLAATAEEHPLVLVVDDFQWSGEISSARGAASARGAGIVTTAPQVSSCEDLWRAHGPGSRRFRRPEP
jgi:hypothetical protein